MVIVLLMVLFFGLVGLGLWAYSHSLLTNAAAQAARFSANADVASAEAVSAKATQILSDSLLGSLTSTVTCTAPTPSNALMVEVHCTIAPPLDIPLFSEVIPSIEVTAHALRERP